MDRKLILLAIISCINADHLNRNLLPPDLPPANVANIYHESGITFVSPTSNVEISSSVLAPPLPITHAFGFVSHSPNGPQELVRTHSSQLVAHGLHSSVSALRSPNGIHSNVNGPITSHRNALDDVRSPQIEFDARIAVPPSDIVQARFVENEFHGVHEVNSRTQHFEYKVPFPRTVPQHGHNEHYEPHFDHHDNLYRPQTIVRHSTYGVPSHISSQIPSQEPTFTPSHIPSHAPSQIPSQVPLQEPTFTPSHVSSSVPSQVPSFTPSHIPSSAPSQIPSHAPSFIPSHISSSVPSQIPSQAPAFIPSQAPAFIPSQAPSFIPSQEPSFIPSQEPSFIPSQEPSFIPSNTPFQDELNEPTFIPTPEEIDALPVFQNDKFLSPFARHTKTPITSNVAPSPQTIDSIFDTSFRPTPARSAVNNFEPSPVHSTNAPTTQTSENIIGVNNRYENRFSLPDGTKVSEQGKLISPQVGWENVIAKTGEYEYVSPEGIPVKVKWIADHEGFRVLN